LSVKSSDIYFICCNIIRLLTIGIELATYTISEAGMSKIKKQENSTFFMTVDLTTTLLSS